MQLNMKYKLQEIEVFTFTKHYNFSHLHIFVCVSTDRCAHTLNYIYI